MKTEKIQSSIVTPRTTGYSAMTGICLTVWSGVSHNKNLRKIHKPFAWITAFLSAVHIGLIEYYRQKFKH